jgi:ketosteroid isomerase-like protein
MSQENVEVMKTYFEVWNTADLDALREMFDPEVIMRPLSGWPEGPGPFIGRDAVMRQWEHMRTAFDADTLEVVGDYVDVADHVVVRLIWHGAGRGPDADLKLSGIYTLRRGKVFGAEFFWDHAEALEALGLSEQDAHADP